MVHCTQMALYIHNDPIDELGKCLARYASETRNLHPGVPAQLWRKTYNTVS